MSITYNKNKNLLLKVLNNCISAKSAPLILSKKYECTFRFPNFLIIVLCNSFANCCIVKSEGCLSSETTSELIPLPLFRLQFFYQKFFKPLKQVYVDIHHILDFSVIINDHIIHLKSPYAMSC